MNTAKQRTMMEELAPVEISPPDEAPPSRKRSRKALVWLIMSLVATAVAGAAWKALDRPAPPSYTAVKVSRGNIANTISATGKVQAVTTVQVGTQVSGTVSELYADFNDHVRAGQVIARLDPSEMEAQLQQTKASLASAQARVAAARSNGEGQNASVAAAKASIENANAGFTEADRAYKTTESLVQFGAAPRRQLETAEATRTQAQAQTEQVQAQYRQAESQVKAGGAALDQALADATQAKAAEDVATVNLERTYIRSPIDGVVVARNVDVGQTVASSLQAPILFLIAKDLTKMQVLADVDEADVGQLRTNDTVSFTVDAFPQKTFPGKISQIRLSPNVVQNVTTYTAVIDVDNPQLELKPGMTANITATVAEKQNVLLVPNAALRYRPENTAAPVRGSATVVWKVEGQDLKPIRLKLGMTDGVSTEVISGDLAEGDTLASSAQVRPATPQQPSTSPFSGAGAGRRGRI